MRMRRWDGRIGGRRDGEEEERGGLRARMNAENINNPSWMSQHVLTCGRRRNENMDEYG